MMLQSESIQNLIKALIQAQMAFKPVIKNSENPYFKSKYADLATIWDACKEALWANGLTVAQMNAPAENGVTIVTQLMHESGEWLRGELKMTPTKNDPQGFGSAISYARRYALAAIVGICPSDDDDDGNAASIQEASKRGKQKVTPLHPSDSNKAACLALDIQNLMTKHSITPQRAQEITGYSTTVGLGYDDLWTIFTTLKSYVTQAEAIPPRNRHPEDSPI